MNENYSHLKLVTLSFRLSPHPCPQVAQSVVERILVNNEANMWQQVHVLWLGKELNVQVRTKLSKCTPSLVLN